MTIGSHDFVQVRAQTSPINAHARSRQPVPGRIAVLIAIVLVAGCAGPTATTSAPADSPPAGATASPILTATASPGPTPPSTPTTATSCAERVLAGMSLAQQVGQLFLLGLPKDQLGPAEIAAIQDEHVGSVWLTTRTAIGVKGVRAIADAVQAQASAAATAGVLFFVAANQEGGLIQALEGPGFSTMPSALVQGGVNPAILEADARRWGRELRAAGVNLDFAPVSDVVPPGGDVTNQPIGLLRREYGHDPLTAGRHAAAFVAGMAAAGVATTAKHFPGLGRVADNTDFSAGVVDRVTTASDPYLASFRASIDAGVPFVMVALATYTRIDRSHLAAFSSRVIGGLLRGDLGFRGVVMSDSLTAAAVRALPPGQRALDFLLAGGDLIVTNGAKATAAMVTAVKGRAAIEPGFLARVNDAALRVLQAKQAAGLLPCSG